MKFIVSMLGLAACLASGDVLGQNTPPTVSGPGVISVEQNVSRSIAYSELISLTGARDADGNTLKVYITALVNGSMTKNGSAIVMGDTTVSAGESVLWTPPLNAYGTVVAFKVRVSDGFSYSAMAATINATISGNTPPTLSAIDTFSRAQFRHALKNTPYYISYDRLLEASDLVDADGDALNFVIGSVGTGSLTMDGAPVVAGQTVFGAGKTLTWTPSQIGALVTAFSVLGFDGKDRSSSAVPVRVEVIDPTPVFRKGADVIVLRDSLDNVIWDWAQNIGPVNSALQFEVSTDKPGLFLYQPEITPDGALLFSLDGIQYGVANMTVVLVDDAGRRSLPQLFKITVGFVNYPPTFSLNSDVVAPEYLTAINSVNGFAMDIDRGAPNETEVVKFEVITDSPASFLTKPTITPAGTLTYRLAPTATGTARVTVIANDGKARSAAQSFSIQVPASPFASDKGVYSGLFFEADQVRHESSGLLTLNLTDRGACSGKLLVNGAALSFAGAFNMDGIANFAVKRMDAAPLQVALKLDGGQMTGAIAESNWSAGVEAEKAFVGGAANAGKYTMVFGKGTGPVSGNGAFAFSVSPNGQVSVSGSMADGAMVSQKTFINSKLQWPFYRSLYAGRGSAIGWVSIIPENIGGTISWSKGASDLMSGAFEAELPAVGSEFMTNAPVLFAGSRQLSIGGGSMVNASAVSVKVAGLSVGGSGISISVNAKTGLAGGTFIHPVSKVSAKVVGAVLQNVNDLKGYFMEPAAVGGISLQP